MAISRAEEVKISSNNPVKRTDPNDLISLVPSKKTTEAAMGILFGDAPGIMTETVTDPLKQNVASPLSKYLASQTGQGVARYTGDFAGKFPEGSLESAQNFMDIDPESFFAENIAAPATSKFKDQLAVSKEDFAGRLSGSGRFRTEEESISKFNTELASSKANFLINTPQAQFAVAQQIKQEDDKRVQLQYQDWLKSLPQYNPVLEASLKFLNESTSTGTTVLSYLDEGSDGIIGGVLNAVASIFGE